MSDATDGAVDEAAGDEDAAAGDAAVSTAEARRLLRNLVAIPSASGDERECAEQLAAFLAEHGREVWLDEVGNVRAPGDDGVLLTSHLDTVPGEVPVETKGSIEVEGAEVLWGRGSVDAKGSLAAMAVAAVETGVSFAGVVGEETDSRGARHLVETREEPEAVVNGEPSGWDAVTLGYRGFLAGTYRAETASAHTSRPEPNAVETALAWWSRVEDVFAADAETPVFEQVTAKPVEFRGGPADDGLSVEAEVEVEFRLPPGATADEVRETAEDALESGSVEWREAIPPVMSSPRTAVARVFRAAIREAGGDPRLLRKTGTADVNLYAQAWNCPTATYGPGDSALDHAPDERIDLAGFDRSVAVLESVCRRLL
jgi:LysW-gamma-L-lysine carboxypeptidase